MSETDGAVTKKTEEPVASGSPGHLAVCSLVLSAVGIPHTFDRQRGSISVPADVADAARHHLSLYFAENRGWPHQPPPAKKIGTGGNPLTLLIIGSLALFYLVTGPWQAGSKWFAAGAINSAAILQHGQWWRLVTALTLHADQVHLLGNCVIGGFIVHLLNRALGYGLGLMLLIGGGIGGNLLNIAARDQVHLSVGFSTSIFAAIGIFSGLQLLYNRGTRLRNLLIPLGSGISLLAMLGVSGERTDLGAHLFGFLCGLGTGVLLGRLDIEHLAKQARLQFVLFLLTTVFLVFSWKVALS